MIKYIVKLAKSMDKDKYFQEELIQEGMIKLFKLEKFIDEQNNEASKKVSVKNHMIDILRKKKKEQHREVYFDDLSLGKNFGYDYLIESTTVDEIFDEKDRSIAHKVLEGAKRADLEYIGYTPTEYQAFRRRARKTYKEEGWI